MSTEVTNLLASKFIQRRDVKAVQRNDGSYVPRYESWTRAHLEDHLSGARSYGHYLLDTDDKCKFFVFDIDLEKTGFLPTAVTEDGWDSFVPCNPREIWRDRSNPARGWIKYQMRILGGKLMSAIWENLEIQTAMAYSGNKGIHVYGFTGSMKASDVREASELVLDATGEFKLHKGRNFYKHQNQHAVEGFPNFSIEVFPKQNSLDGKDLGNLVRLPLGRNLKSPDPTFFVDVNAPMSVLKPIDPVWALTTSNPWITVAA